MRVLYLSYDGLTDPLGQSQIMPYLIKLAEKGHRIDVVSFEKQERWQQSGKKCEAQCTKAKLGYYPLSYTKQPPVLSTLIDIWRMKKMARRLHQKNNYQIVHCRSYIAGIVGEWMKDKFNTRFIFDMRGFYADERVDGSIWPQRNPLFRWVYQYFKRKERDFLKHADHTISLTHAAKSEIEQWKIPVSAISVIPCCVDNAHFDRTKISPKEQNTLRKTLGLEAQKPVVGYVGSTGTWYLLKEMLIYFKALLASYPQAAFLFVTLDHPESIQQMAAQLGIPGSALRIKGVDRSELPVYLSLMDWSVFFIQPVFSKKASSPTKQAELMSMGIPVVCNAGVGDTDRIVQQFESGVIATNFSEPEIQRLVHASAQLFAPNTASIISGAQSYFSLERGVEKLDLIYRNLAQ